MQDLLKIEYKDWFINQKRTPDKESGEYRDFYNFHKRLCTEGCMIGDTFFNPFLMWHLNFWHTSISEQDEKGRIYEVYGNPSLRDNEWMVTNEIYKAEQEHKGLVIFGIRRFSKSTLESSYIAWGATFDENSQNIIAGLNGPDIKVLTDMIDKGLNRVPDAWRWQRIEDNWKNQVTLGIKTKDGMRIPFSSILIRNLDDGNNQEAIAGTKPRKLIIDEALEENELVYLKDKSIPIKDVSIGDKVYGRDGKLTRVLDKIDVGVRNIWEFTLADGRTIKSSDNHQWSVYNTVKNTWDILTTEQIRSKYIYEKVDGRTNKTYKSCIYSLPTNEPLVKEKKELKIDPYWLGLFLGDGLKTNTCICSIDDSIIEYCQDYATKLGLRCTIRKDTKKNEKFRYASIVDTEGKKNSLREHLRYYNVFDNKHIPDDYLDSSIEDRLEVLRGLMDTDGSVDNKGHIEFTSSREELAVGVIKLLRELGINYKLTKRIPTYTSKEEKKKGKLSYRFMLYTDLEIFKLDRKLKALQVAKDRINNNTKKRTANQTRVTITDIKYWGKAQAYCIKVDNQDNLFLTTDYIVTKNCGKGNFLNALQAAIPGFTTPFGWGCSPICTGTSGDMKKFMDAKSLFFDTDQYNFMSYNSADDTKTVHGLFISNKYRLESKEPSNMSSFLGIEDKKLQEVPILISNEEKATAILTTNLEKLKKAGDRNAYLKEKMYYPKEVNDIFLNEDTNIFNILAAQRQAARLRDEHIQGSNVFLEHDGEKIIHKFTNKMPITNFPHKPNDDTDAPIVIYEMPIKNPPFGLYVAGVDPYRQANSKMSSSLGAVYILKRMHDIQSEKFQDMVVASYVSRPENKDKWNEQARMLIKYYNARTLVENDEMSFIEYMKNKGDAQYLERQPPWLKEIVPNTTVNRDYGIHRSSQKVIDYMHNCLKEYLDEVIYSEKDEKGSEIKEVLGVARIRDRMLLDEIIQFTDDGNFDRIVAVELAIALANHLDNIIKIGGTESDSRIKELYNKAKKMGGSLFGTSDNLFKERKSKLWL